MPNYSPVVTEEIFEKNIIEKLKEANFNWNLGRHLFLLKTTKDGKCTFYLRIKKNGTDTKIALGSYSEGTNFKDARKNADEKLSELNEQIEKMRAKKSETKFQRILKEPAIDRRYQLIDLKSAQQLTSLLYSQIYKEDISQLEREAYLGTLIALLAPTIGKAIFSSRRMDINLHYGIWQRQEVPNSRQSYPSENESKLIRLGKITCAILNNYLTTRLLNDPIFPNLSELKLAGRNRVINDALDKISPKKMIRVAQFKSFFRNMAVTHSELKEPFIKQFIANKILLSSHQNPNPFLVAIIDWWENQIFTRI